MSQSKQQRTESTEAIHELWLIYCQLKDAESDAAIRDELLASAREQLGQVINALNRSV